MTIVQFILLIFLGFALSRVILRFRNSQVSPLEFIFWAIVFLFAIIGVLLPDQITRVAKLVGIGRGVDLITYSSIALLFYLIFRIYILMEDIRHEITILIRKMALEKVSRKR